jgi:Zn-dependent M28 family amino/carboxypeptidase
VKNQRRVIFLAGLLLAVLSVSAIRVDRLQTHVSRLASPDLAGRRSGQPGAVKAAQYIFDQFRQAGFDVRMQEFSDNRRNVVARFGSKDRHIILGAHYDGQFGLPSASDNAAGVAAIIELATELKAMNLPVSLVAIAFDDEEQGLNGSNFYANNPIFPLEQVAAAIVFDTMGRHFLDLKKSTLFVLGAEYSNELSQVIERRKQPDMLVAGTDLIGPRSDFAGFALKKVPFLFFSHATHKDYHGAGDRPELIDYPKTATDLGIIRQIIVDIARSPKKPVYLDKPVYPASEVGTLLRIIKQVRAERPDLPLGYKLVFEDLEQRIQTDQSRATMNVAASTLIALATPRFSPAMLELFVVPAYQKANKPEIVQALLAEAARWER